jgi:hypothetical protein
MNTVAPLPLVPPRQQPSIWLDGLHAWALFNLSVTQSFYSRLARQSEYLVDPDVTPDSVLCAAIVMSLVLPLIIAGAVVGTGRLFPRCREAMQTCVVLFSSTLLLLQALHLLPIAGIATLLLATGGGAILGWLYQKSPAARQIVTVASVGIVLSPCLLYSEFWHDEATAGFQLNRDSTRPRVPVVLVVFDEFAGASLLTPEHTIDATRFPHFSKLASESTWYRHACANASLTLCALPAILTGQSPPDEFSIPKNYSQSLFLSLKSGAQYDYVAFEPVSVVAPQNDNVFSTSRPQTLQRTLATLGILSRVYLFDVVPTDFHRGLPEIPRSWFGLSRSDAVDRSARRGRFRYSWSSQRDQQFTHFLECIDETREGILYFGHFLLPHAPWCFLPSGKRYAPDQFEMNRGCLETAESITDELGLVQEQQRYLLQQIYLDRAIGQLVERLKASGIYDDCLLIVTADHGVSFRLNSSRRELVDNNVADICGIPLFVKYPGQSQGAVRDEIVQSTDIVPTIFETVGLHPHLPLSGLSLNDPRIQERQSATFTTQSRLRSIPGDSLRSNDLPEIMRRRFGDGRDPWNIYRIGPHSEFLGQPRSQFRINSPVARDADCFVSTSRAIDLIHPEFYLEAQLRGPIPDSPVEMVVVVNNVVVATTRTYTQFGYQDRWSAMLPEWSYSEKESTPEVYILEPDQSLTPCRVHWYDRPAPQDSVLEPESP